jgi:WD40 repeat protein
LRVWDTATGACRINLQGHASTIQTCALSADGHVALSGSLNGTLRVWDVNTGSCHAALSGFADCVVSCAVSADGLIGLSASLDPNLRAWDLRFKSVATSQCKPASDIFVRGPAWSNPP